jgi:Spy/CpxP family protein refolding chaperone
MQLLFVLFKFTIMKTRIIKYVGVLFLSMFMFATIHAQSPRQDRFAALDLTEEQQAEITALRTEHFKAVTPLKNRMAELKARERTLLSEENVDMKAVNKTIDEQSELSNSIRKLQVAHQVEIKGLLSDEQVMKLQQRRQFAQQNTCYGKSGRNGHGTYGVPGGRGGAGMHGGAGMGRGYRGI